MARPAVPASSHASNDLIERERELSMLGECLDSVRSSSRGRLVFVAGEAGVGKTALLRRFCDASADGARVLWGACDALFTPRPLGPFGSSPASSSSRTRSTIPYAAASINSRLPLAIK